MRLSDDEVEEALYCVAELVDRRRREGTPVPHWMLRLARHLDLASLMSRSRHEQDCDAEESEASGGTTSTAAWLSAREAAEQIGLSKKQTTRLHADLDALLIDGRFWIFPAAAVTEYAEGRRDA